MIRFAQKVIIAISCTSYLLLLLTCEKREFIEMPAVTTGEAVNIGVWTAQIGGNVIDIGEGITDHGHCYSATPNPTIKNDKVSLGATSSKETFTTTLSELTPGTTYYVRAYAMSGNEIDYGNEQTFDTRDGVAILTTYAVTSISINSASGGGEITDNGGDAIVSRGICWNTTGNPTVEDSVALSGSGTGSYTEQLSKLSPNTAYYVSAFATNGVQTTYADPVSFLTNDGTDLITTKEIIEIKALSAIGGGIITANGETPFTKRGVCWNTTGSPTINDFKTEEIVGVGEFASLMTELLPETTYYVRAYGTNSLGTAYGNIEVFTTEDGIPTLTTNAIIDITINSATGGGNITDDGGDAITASGVCWNTTGNPTLDDSISYSTGDLEDFTSDLFNLSPNTEYYVKVFAINGVATTYGNSVSFMTSDGSELISTTEISDINAYSAKSGGEITGNGSAPITSRGVCWNTTGNPTIDDNATNDGTGIGVFISDLTDLTPSTTYYVKAYSTNSLGTIYGSTKQFTTRNGVPELTTATLNDITINSATSGGEIIDDGGDAITARGVCWNTAGNPTIVNSKTIDGSGTGSFSSSMTGLTENTTYYVRSYGTNSLGTIYGTAVQFITRDGIPVLTTTAIDDITAFTATGGGEIIDDGGDAIITMGVCWNTTGTPTIADSKTSDGDGPGAFTSTIANLTENTVYYVRAYGTNSIGTTYSTTVQFTTRDGIPILTTIVISEITAFTVSSGGEITDDGGDAITARGVCWNTTGSPTVADSKTTDGSGTGVFTSSIVGLTENTTYYVRAYATNNVGTVYGTVGQFNTRDGIPMLTTNAITDITATTAKASGEITDDGGDDIIQRGICWNTTGNPTISDIKTINESGTGTFTSSITGLTGNTIYYVRAYATNSAGTVYGTAQQFTTLDGIPILTTGGITDITINSATGGGEITDDGGDGITARGVCWNTSGSPTITDSKTINGSGTGAFTSSIIGLTENTTYYVRAYATNSVGTVYGTSQQFISRDPVIDIDGNTYLTVQIGTQIWMAENLKTTQYNDGTAVTLITNFTTWDGLTTEAYCWYNNNEVSYKADYGALYNWYAVNTGKLCPTGWHVPSDTEWKTLEMYLGMSQAEADNNVWRGTDEGGKLKEAGTYQTDGSHWNSPNTGATNSSGFTGLPGGMRYYVDFGYMYNQGRWWTSTESNSSQTWNRLLLNSRSEVSRGSTSKEWGYSVRCLKD